jgi:hypothetical protein
MIMGKKGSRDTRRQVLDKVQLALRISNELSLFESAAHQLPETSAAFLRRCEAAAAVALGLARLAREKSRVGFLPLPLTEYLEELAKSARVELRPLLAASDTGVKGEDSGPFLGLARLCQRLGFSLRETLLHLGLGLAESHGAPPVSMMMARQNTASSGRDPFATYEAALRGVLSEIGATQKLEALEAELRLAYAESRHGE